jgi:hypothetical protein
MGTNVSKTSVDVVNESVVNSILAVGQTCNTSINTNQNMNISGTNLFGSNTQSVTLNATCIQNVQITSDLISQMANDIKTQATQSGIALLPSINVDESNTTIKNLLTINITNSFLQNCAAALTTSQTQNVSGFNLFTSSTQDVDVVTKCMSDSLNQNNFAQSIVADTSQVVSQANANPLDAIANILSSVTSTMVIVICVFIGIIILIIYGISRLFS